MEKLLTQMLNQAKKGDRKSLKSLKNMAIGLQQYELAAGLRDIETTLYPETDEIKDIKKEANQFVHILSMVGLNVNIETSQKLLSTFRKFEEKKFDFTLQDAHEIQTRNEIIFDL